MQVNKKADLERYFKRGWPLTLTPADVRDMCDLSALYNGEVEAYEQIIKWLLGGYTIVIDFNA